VDDLVRCNCGDRVIAVRERLPQPRELELHEQVARRPVQERVQELDEVPKRRAPVGVAVKARLDGGAEDAVALAACDAPLTNAAEDAR